jgi:hypothetical protein
MGAVLVPVLIVVIVALLVWLAVRSFSHREHEHSDRLRAERSNALLYEVPPGQDPAVVLVHLESEGYDVSADDGAGAASPILIIGSRDSAEPDREAVRRALHECQSTNINPEESAALEPHAVRFVDE